ncbi:MAG TPA: RecQ family ATP-dependent DNA helicase [Candidatus Kapabacteria bacterium]|nr:RecQ family ATP-dependent DNA helicase [Candidatus Kapabacteria bacterium]
MIASSGYRHSSEELREVLRARFGLEQFRAQQEEAISSLLYGRDVLVVMPTGGGKSLCYQLPAAILPGVALIVSPLIALMKDQVDRLNKLDIPAVALNSTLYYSKMKQVFERAEKGLIKALLVSPERLESAKFREELSRLPISFIAIDEAHCISEWGHDFRTSYRRLTQVYDIFEGKRPPVIALTATATPEVRKDIIKQLELDSPLEIVTGFARENVQYGVLTSCDKDLRTVDILRGLDGSAIIYASTRKNVEALVPKLGSQGINAVAYHAGQPTELRRRIQDQFLKGDAKVIVATSAFGMGIDKADVRAVIHYDLPSTLEGYYQESGRAGRDGNKAFAVLLYNEGDTRSHEYLIRLSTPSDAELRNVYGALHDIVQNTLGNVHESSFIVDESNIMRRIVQPQASLERILDVLEEEGYLYNHRWQISHQRSSVRFLAARGRFEEISFRTQKRGMKTAVDALMRSVGADGFSREVDLDEDQILEDFPLSTTDWKDSLRILESMGAIQYRVQPKVRAGNKAFVITLLGERVPTNKLPLRMKFYEQRREKAIEKLSKVVDYATSWDCRTRTILNYFGDPSSTACGSCDVCRAGSREAT